MIKLTRQLVARQEIDTAIRLLFSGGRPITVHVLAWAAVDVLKGVAEARGVRTFHGEIHKRIRPEHLGEWKQAERNAYNFFKHSDRDPEREIDDFNPELPWIPLLAAVVDYGEIYHLHTFPMVMFKSWVMWRRPDFWTGDFGMAAEILGAGLGDPHAVPYEESFYLFNEMLSRFDRSPDDVLATMKINKLER